MFHGYGGSVFWQTPKININRMIEKSANMTRHLNITQTVIHVVGNEAQSVYF